jgi:ribokinase
VARYLTLGHLLVEDTVLPDGERVLGRLGGDSLYAAMGARVWSDDARPIARFGPDFPPRLLATLRAAGYAEGLVPCERPSVRMWVHWGVEGKRRFTFRDGSGTYEEQTVLPQEIPSGRRILPLVDAFLPSRAEATDLLGGWPGPEAAAAELAGLGAPVVVLKLRAAGSLAYGAADGAFFRVRSAVREPVDASGSGDTFCGGFLVGFAETGDIQLALGYGAVSASFVASDYGCEHALAPDREEAKRRLRELLPPTVAGWRQVVRPPVGNSSEARGKAPGAQALRLAKNKPSGGSPPRSGFPACAV